MITNREEELKARFSKRMGRSLIFTANHMGHLLAKQSNRELTRLGFTLQIEQVPILFMVYFSGEDLLSQGEIANMLQKDKSGIQRSLRTLERDGYLRIVPDSIDRRKNLIQLTPAGKMVVEKAIETAETIDKQVTDQLTTEELDAFLATLRKISSILEK
ncbi:MarR family winged helix-turn-helix transcriptional regulator [Spirosoma panaciterrae]|uniref:MarR family winged helix-turn-helix transcriptional regulator n=1 Tax=Spirosoma panaciterrae TaxID=496058 RepID=UPI0003A0FFCF|nr:MarR family transcriptional regulator [Spirosoma panaciterrae]